MKKVYGVKLIETQDILKESGGTTPICNFLKERMSAGWDILKDIDGMNKIVIDTTSDRCEDAVMNVAKPFIITFVPTALIEELILSKSIAESVNNLKNITSSPIQNNRLGEIKENYEDKYESISMMYRGRDNIISNPCIMFLQADNVLLGIRAARPINIISSVLSGLIHYSCSSCGKIISTDATHIDTMLPDMRYGICKNEVCYYCEQCASKDKTLNKLPHVGESL